MVFDSGELVVQGSRDRSGGGVCSRIETLEQRWSGVAGWVIVAGDSGRWQWRQRCPDQTSSAS